MLVVGFVLVLTDHQPHVYLCLPQMLIGLLKGITCSQVNNKGLQWQALMTSFLEKEVL